MKKAGYLILTVFAGLMIYVGYVSSQWTSYHDFEGKCLDCHLVEPTPGGDPGIFIVDITQMCTDCHQDTMDLSHPVDVLPSMAVPRELPLDWKGEVTCVTCHPAHALGYGEFHMRSGATGQGFCVLCHDNLEDELHKVAIGTAHVSSYLGANYEADQMEVTLDALSIKCMSCHDAIFAVDSLQGNTVFTKGAFMHNIGSIGLSHPIGMSYYETKRKYRGAYRSVSELPPEIKLFGGVVGCGSCHNPYSKQHYDLVMSNEGSALCLGCHVK